MPGKHEEWLRRFFKSGWSFNLCLLAGVALLVVADNVTVARSGYPITLFSIPFFFGMPLGAFASVFVLWLLLARNGRAMREYAPFALAFIVILLTECWYWSPLNADLHLKLADRGLKAKVEQIVGIAQLQQWAEKMLSRPLEELPLDGEGRVRAEAWPAGLANFDYTRVFVQEEQDGLRYVQIFWGGGFFHYGVLIGSPSFHPEETRDRRVCRWADGVYGWQER